MANSKPETAQTRPAQAKPAQTRPAPQDPPVTNGRAPDAGTPDAGTSDAKATAAKANQVKFDTSALKSTYCNVCNGSSTREEVVLNFGANTTWDLGRDQLEVALHHRIVMSPHAAKRVRDMMVRLIDEHEARHGKLDG
jgi:hypothetical protein